MKVKNRFINTNPRVVTPRHQGLGQFCWLIFSHYYCSDGGPLIQSGRGKVLHFGNDSDLKSPVFFIFKTSQITSENEGGTT